MDGKHRHDVFRIRLNCIDFAQYAPNTLDPPIWGPRSLSATQRVQLPDVPVIRVWGSTETGQKACVHVHGAFPYLYVPYVDSIEESQVAHYISNLRSSIDHALCLSYRRNPYDNPRNATFVAHISLVKGVPFFGYNVGYKYYLKIYLLNPLHMTRFADLLHQGAILRQHFQPYEAHLQYQLQWMCDFNLYGCAYIEVSKPRFRAPIPPWEEMDDLAHLWHDRSIDPEHVLDADQFPRQSHCQLEVDIRVEDILNRNAIQARPLHHSFIERMASLENLPPEEKLVHSMAGLWKDETRRRKRRMGISDPSSSPFPPEVLVSMSADPRNDSTGGWVHEDEFRDAIAELAEQEKKQRGGAPLSFESFGSQKHDHDDGVQTVLESVSELFHTTLEQKWDKLAPPTEAREQQPHELSFEEFMGTQLRPDHAPVVDESSIALMGEDEGYLSDEDAAKELALTQKQKLEDAGLEEAMGEANVNESVGAALPQSIVEGTQQPNSLKRSAPSGSQLPFKKARMDAPDYSSRWKHMYRPSRAKDIGTSSRPGGDGFAAPPAAQARNGVFVNERLTDAPPSAQPPSSQRSLESSHGDKIAFPSVKNAHESNSGRRLSQRASQLSQKDALVSSTASSFSNKSLQSPEDPRQLLHPTTALAYADGFGIAPSCRVLMLRTLPPTQNEVATTVNPSVIYQDAYYSNEKDVPERVREYAGQEFRLESNTLPFLPPFDSGGVVGQAGRQSKADAEFALNRRRWQCSLKSWELMKPPPSRSEVERWLRMEEPSKPDDLNILDLDGPPSAPQLKRKNKPPPELSQIEGPTQRNKHGFKYSQRKASTSVQHETGYMSTMSLEVHVNSRADLAPDPERDEVNMVFWCIADEQMDDSPKLGILVLIEEDEELPAKIRKMVGDHVQIDSEDNELDLINRMVDIVREYDIDILTGYEVHNNSWGYLIERARLHYEFNLPDEFSRMKSHSKGRFGRDADRWGFTHTSTVSITGRHTINIWRAMRSELNLLQYTMENVVFHLLHRRIPHYTYATLTRWYKSDRPRDLAKVLDYLVTRTKLDLEILDANELIPRTSEQARLLGVDFFSVFSRGSQFKVESLMFRIAKPESFVLVSPSRKQVGSQNALECLPLVMEPQSAFYSSPLLVLDFQSLYPSVMIAYNYCYSTCLGRVTKWRGTNKMGFTDFKRHPGLLELTKDKLNVAPNGMMYVKPEMRKSLLAKMLGEILETRVMVKSGMKVDRDDKTLQQLLNNRQLALKLIANVTYGYTSASYSGRMPCSEIADSIVQTGRETLEKAIALIHSVERWGAEVVYGDTDSLFVYLKGRTKDDAFRIGDEIAQAVTDTNPRPIKLKFEKVYHPCVLLAKKRYVGFKYESPSQKEPDFDAKGIETVRRDGTPAEQKIEEKALKLLFRTSDLSQVKAYFQGQCTKILTGRFSVQDFCFAKEVKLGTYADRGPPPPGALIATRRMLKDPRQEPQYGERIPYVVVAGAPGARLWERCVEPEQLIRDENAELDAEYYINKNLIPPLERIFNLVGANVRSWWDELPKVQRIRQLSSVTHPQDHHHSHHNNPPFTRGNAKISRKTMESYMGTSSCLICHTKLSSSSSPLPPPKSASSAPQPPPISLPLCPTCRYSHPTSTLLHLRRKFQSAELQVSSLYDVCRSCAGLAFDEEICCESRDCEVFYSRVKAETRLRGVRRGVGRVLEVLEGEVAGVGGEREREGLEW